VKLGKLWTVKTGDCENWTMKLGTVKLGLGNWETEDCEKLETVKLGL